MSEKDILATELELDEDVDIDTGDADFIEMLKGIEKDALQELGVKAEDAQSEELVFSDEEDADEEVDAEIESYNYDEFDA